jgi:putative ABC transport system permease protein
VIYVIIGKGLTAKTLANELNRKGNNAHAYQTNYQLIVLKQLVIVPQTLLAILVLLFTFISLLVADYVAELKKIGVRRLAGESVPNFIFRNLGLDSFHILQASLLSIAGALTYLALNAMLGLLYIEIIALTISVLACLLLLIVGFVSLVIFIIIKNQPIHLLIKGKIPIRGLTLFIVSLQIFSVLTAVYAVANLSTAEKRIKQLKQGQEAWSHRPQYYGLTRIQGDTDKKDWQRFLAELFQDTNNMLIANQFDEIYASEHGYNGPKAKKQTKSYYPMFSSFSDSNILIVSYPFLKKEQIGLAPDLKKQLSNLSPGQYGLLIPQSQKSQIEALTAAWRKYYEPPKDTPNEAAHVEQLSGLYTAPRSNIFAYPVYGPTHFLSDDFYAQDPIIIVYGAETFQTEHIGLLTQYIYQFLITDPDKTRQLIKKYHLELAIGSFINGYAATNQRLKTAQTQQLFLVGTTLLALISSVLLTYLINTIYLYQNRRKFTIERLSGMATYHIHQGYLAVVLLSSLVIELAIVWLHLPAVTYFVPLTYLILIGIVLSWQIQDAKKAQVQYLKGE